MRCTPESECTGPESSPTARANAAFSKAGCICPCPKIPRSPPFLALLQSEYCDASSASDVRPETISSRYSGPNGKGTYVDSELMEVFSVLLYILYVQYIDRKIDSILWISSSASSGVRVMFSSRQLEGLRDLQCFTRRWLHCTWSEGPTAGAVGNSYCDSLVSVLR